MSTDTPKQSDKGSEEPDPEDVPSFEGQVVFKGHFESIGDGETRRATDE
ncbi:hypothetical protein RYH80_09745 [Halobaculum sp. MBLA0147]